MRSDKSGPPQTVDEYFDRLPSRSRALLGHLRKVIRSEVPNAEEIISYRMPAFRYHGVLVYYAAFEDHCSLFIGSESVRRRFEHELRPYASGKGTYRFTDDMPIPDSLVRRIVKARVVENDRKHAKRSRPTPSRNTGRHPSTRS